MPKINLAVIFGGKSGEHEVSLNSAKQIIEALNKEKYNIIPIAITKKGKWLIGNKGNEYLKLYAGKTKEDGISIKQSQGLVSINNNEKSLTNFIEGDTEDRKIDLALPILHGPYGEDGKLQGMLDMLGVPYVFSGTLASALSMNKDKTKIIAQNTGLNVIPDIILSKGEDYNIKKIINKLSLPIVIKPMELGSSVGMSIAKNEKELEQGIEQAFKHDIEIMLEKFIKGRELTVGVMSDKMDAYPLPVIEIIPKVSDWFDYKAKYEKGGSDEICPANIPDNIRNEIQKMALNIFQAIKCRGVARADFIWSRQDNKLYFLEINTIPGMTATSLVPQAAKTAGMEFGEFLDKLIQGALDHF